jgi:hypothetical protein
VTGGAAAGYPKTQGLDLDREVSMRTALLVAIVLTLGCTDALDTGGREYALTAAVGEEFSLRIGERALLEDLALDVRFLEVAEDSRCPSNALILCVWIGDAAVVIETTPQFADAVHDTLHTTLEPKAVQAGTVVLRLVSVDPYPEDVGPIPVEEYRATFVTEAP